MEWMIVYVLMSGEIQMAEATEDSCRKAARTLLLGQPFTMRTPAGGVVPGTFWACAYRGPDGITMKYSEAPTS